jgi:hypothetical protein
MLNIRCALCLIHAEQCNVNLHCIDTTTVSAIAIGILLCKTISFIYLEVS